MEHVIYWVKVHEPQCKVLSFLVFTRVLDFIPRESMVLWEDPVHGASVNIRYSLRRETTT